MEPLDPLKPEVARLFAAKEARRHELAALPFPDKVRAVVRLQRWRLRCCAHAENTPGCGRPTTSSPSRVSNTQDDIHENHEIAEFR